MILAQLPLLWRSGLICAKSQGQFGGTVVALGFYNFNRDTFTNGNTRMVAKKNKFTTAWCVPSNWTGVPLAVRCQINKEKSRASQAQHKTKLHSDHWWSPTTSQIDFCAQCNLICATWQAQPGRTLVALAFTTSTVTPLAMARRGWLAKQICCYMVAGIKSSEHSTGNMKPVNQPWENW